MVMLLKESETLELKKSTSELKEAVISIAAILNKRGKGRLYFGVKNDGNVTGQQVGGATLREVSRAIAEHIEPKVFPLVEKISLEGKDCIRVAFSGKDVPYLAYGRAYIRVADEDRQVSGTELGRMFLARDDEQTRWESQVSRKKIADMNEKVLKFFVRRANVAGRIDFSFQNARTTLNKLGLISGGKPLRAAEVLFCDEGPLEVQAAVFAGTDKRTFIDIKQFRGNAFELLEKSEAYLKEHLNWRVQFGSLERKEIPEVPFGALREALVNSVCHRDYRNPKGNEVAIFRDRVEIYNPGEFPAGHTPEDFLSGRERSILRNPLIAETLFKSKDIEKWGSGLKRIADECKEQGVGVKFEIIKTGFLVTFIRKAEEALSHSVVDKTVVKTVVKASDKIISLIAANTHITVRELARQTGLTVRGVEWNLQKLRKDGKLKRIGGRKAGHWEVSA
jgi:ATP-dependent DNA helicase RecG